MRRAVPLSTVVRAEAALAQTCHGACACGTVRYAVRIEGERATRCICARCRGHDLRILTLPRGRFRLLTGRDELTEPMQDARTPHHFFCARCGEAAFGYPQGSEGPLVSVNAALLERGDPDAIAGEGPA